MNPGVARHGLAIVLATFLACGPARPGMETWLEAWNEAQAAVPDPATMAGKTSHASCKRLLTTTRVLRERLLSSPDPALDGPIEDWLGRAGQIGFDCPTAHGDLDTYHEVARELAVLTDAINAGLATIQRQEGEAGVQADL